MTFRVLLVSANLQTVPFPVYPVALARLAGALHHAGHEVRQFDVLSEGLDALAPLVDGMKPDLVGISLRNVDNTNAADSRGFADGYREVMKRVRGATTAPVVLGGSGFSLFPLEMMQELGADFGVVGAGEEPLLHLVTALSRHERPEGISSLIRAGESVAPRLTPALEVVSRQLHEERLVSWYWKRGGMVGIQTKRGCPFECSYCTYPLIDGARMAYCEVAVVVDQIEELHRRFGVTYFYFTDSVFNLRPEHETALAREILKRGLRISWGGFFAPTRLSHDYLALLRESGLKHVEFGTDSFSDPVLDDYRKGFSFADVRKATELCNELALPVAHYLIFGGPAETWDTLREGMSNARTLSGSVFFPFTAPRIYRGTRLFEQCVEEGRLSANDRCLDPVFYEPRGMSSPEILAFVTNEVKGDPRWVLPSQYDEVAGRMNMLRQLGVKGPLWEFLLK